MGSAPGGVRQLRRSRENRVLGGVCGGIGEYVGVDPTLIRLAAVLLAIAAGAGVLAYLIAWIVIPEATPEKAGARSATDQPAQGQARVIVGAVLVCAGGILLLDLVAPISLEHRYLWPALLIAIGLAIVARGSTR